MAQGGSRYISGPIPTLSKTLGGGLNTTAGPLGLEDNESPDLQNIDFNKFGSILKRNGYACLNTSAVSETGNAMGLYWLMNSWNKQAILVSSSKIYAMDDLDGTFDDVTGAVSATDSYTKLLLHCNGTNGSTTFADSSPSGHGGATIGGDAQVSTAKQKFETGSLLLDGTGDYLRYDDSTDWTLGSNDFTIDMWIYPVSVSTVAALVWQGASGTNYWEFGLNTSLELFFQMEESGGSTSISATSDFTVTLNAWNHVAVVRNGNNFFFFKNGTKSSVTVDADTIPDFAGYLYIGGLAATNYFNGWIDEIRVSSGIARWTTDFTPPITQYGNFERTDFTTFLNNAFGTDGLNLPWRYAATGTATNFTVPTSLTSAKCIEQFQNYLILGNVTVGGIKYPSRIYWSAIKTYDTWDSADYIDISKDDGDEITGLRVLGDRLVIYKNNSIYVLIFTGDADIPFLTQRTPSHVGCVSPFSIQEAQNGHIFVSHDGIYFFDGNSSMKLSDRINDTWLTLDRTKLDVACSMYEKIRNQYWLTVTPNTSSHNTLVLTWNSFLNSWSRYIGMSASTMTVFLVNGTEERPYFGDYLGYVYRGDYGSDDYPANSKKAINSYYDTNWKSYEDICDKKGIPHFYMTYRRETTNTNMAISSYFDFNTSSQSCHTINVMSASGLTTTGWTERRDLTGRGRFAKIKLSESGTGTSFRIDGLGSLVTLETQA